MTKAGILSPYFKNIVNTLKLTGARIPTPVVALNHHQLHTATTANSIRLPALRSNAIRAMTLPVIAMDCCGGAQVQVRNYSEGPPLTLDIITQRVILVLQLYDKVDPKKVQSKFWDVEERYFTFYVC